MREIHAQRAVSVAVGPAHDGKPRLFIAEMVAHNGIQRGAGIGKLSTWCENVGHVVGLYDLETGSCEMKIGGPLPGEHPEVCRLVI